LFCEILRSLRVDESSGTPKLYKPAMVACVLDGLGDGELATNEISFDWIAPRFVSKMKNLGEDVGEKEAAMPFYHLTGDLFWLLSYNDLDHLLSGGSEGPAAIRAKVSHASLKDSFWAVLQNPDYRQRAMDALTERWWPVARTPRFWVEKTIVHGRPDRQEGENALGRALWSPQTADGGRRIYEAMVEVQPGDVVFHFIDNERVDSFSTAATTADSSFIGVKGTEWADRPAYRIALTNHQKLVPLIERTEFLGDARYRGAIEDLLATKKGLFFNREFNLNQGSYLTEAPIELVQIWNDIHLQKTGQPINEDWNIPRFQQTGRLPPASVSTKIEPYDKKTAMAGLFLEESQFDDMLDALRENKNVVLQGAPGVGKTFVAKRLAYALMGVKDPQRVEMIQFHQSYSYEDFIEGFRPTPQGHFDLKFGLFYEFCRRAQRSELTHSPYVFIIDEINRGNLSKIFGELMMLIEPDKRGKEHAIPLAYSRDADEKFYIPENLYLIGTMNTADRSLAMVDYALRRRFRFITLRPEFASQRFQQFLSKAGAEPDLVNKIVTRMEKLNQVIAADVKNLGPGYQIGHSYFCPRNDIKPDIKWYRRIIGSEIVPLIREYWIDNEEKVQEQRSALLS
jgi:MoxR-like ATPase